MSDTSPNLGLPFYQTKLNEFEVQHNEALLMLDALVMLAVIDRDLSAPPGSPTVGDRYLVKATGTGDFAGQDNRIAQYDIGGWNFYAPRVGWTCYVQDELKLLAWDGDSWEPALAAITEIQNLNLLGVGTTADATNPVSAKLNNTLWVAKTVAEGGDGNLRYKLSKESAAKTLSFLLQNNFSGRAEIGLTGDDDFHFKVSPDGSAWTDALVLDKTTGAAKLNSALYLMGDISPSQITANQNDYNPAGLSGASTLRLSTDASRTITGLAGGADGRAISIINVGSHDIVLTDASASSTAANRFDLGGDLTLTAKQSVVLWYDATDSRWKAWAKPGTGGGSGTVTSVAVAISGAGLSVGGSPITTNGTITITVDAELGLVSVHGADVASSSTINLETATGDVVDVTGTTTITAITLSEGHQRTVRFTGALTLTHGSSLVLPGSANISTAAGDYAIFRGYGSGVVRCVMYQKASGAAISGGGASGSLIYLATLTASNSATLADTTHITSAYDVYEIVFENVLPATNAVYLVANVTEDGGTNWSADLQICGAGATTIGNNANYGVSGITMFLNPNSASYKYLISAQHVFANGSGVLSRAVGLDAYTATTNALNGIRFKFTSGNITSGKIHIYGRKTS